MGAVVSLTGTPDLTIDVWQAVTQSVPSAIVCRAVLPLHVRPGASLADTLSGYQTRLQHVQRLLRQWCRRIEFSAVLGVPTVPARPDPRYGAQFCLPCGGHAIAEEDVLPWYRVFIGLFREAGIGTIALVAQDAPQKVQVGDWCGLLRSDGTSKVFMPALTDYLQEVGL